MDELDVFALTCGHCARGFVVCRPDYRGQGYCGETCREREQAARRRLANARHQRTAEGVIESPPPAVRRSSESAAEIEVELVSGVRLRFAASIDLDYVAALALAERLG